MKVIIDKEFWDLFPETNIEILVLKNVQEDKKLNDTEAKEIKELLDNANKNAKKYLTSDVISENKVVQVWREAYSKFPTKKGARCSLENLLKRVLHDNPVGTITPSVDITNSISLKYAFPIGAEDIDKIDGDIRLDIMEGNEKFIPLGSEEEDPPLNGELAYADDYGVVCRCFNWRDGKRTCIDDNTRNEFIIMECLEKDRVDELNSALNELKDLMTKYLSCEVKVLELVNSDNREIEI
jgi:DNA/RNA-binding domain of Phe-tRNA-synthetase-like protein